MKNAPIRHGYYLPTLGAFGVLSLARQAAEA